VRSVQARLILAFATVALVSIGATAAITAALFRNEFDRYFFGTHGVEPGSAPPSMPHMGDSPAMRSMMRRMMGTPELRFLGQLRRATWRAALLGILVAAVLGVLVARYLTAPLRQMAVAAARIGQGDLNQQVPVPSQDELGRLARAFNAMIADLRRLEDSRRHLMADIAHELGTPLSVLQANLEGMLDGVIETTQERLAAVHTQVRLLARLVSDLRDLSLAQAGRLVLDRRPTDVAALVAEAAAVMLPYATDRGVTVESRIAGAPWLNVDRDRMLQVVHNLLDNAIRHTPSGGTVVAGLEPGPGQVRLWVQDSGPGIPPEEVDRIFDRFYRLDPARSRSRGGTGLGLAIVKSLVEAHGGRVWAESQPGRGSRFVIALPA
jgi:two-component system sensor histidine kinase BaeS